MPGAAPRAAPATFTVTFQPSGRRGSAAAGTDLLSVARGLGVEIESICGGKGTCKKCRVHDRVGRREPHAPTDIEAEGTGRRRRWRQACAWPARPWWPAT